MDKYALIGRNISHSRSPEIYKRLLPFVEYDLLDYSQEENIPKAKELLSEYKGINITSPYKKHFLTEVKLTPNANKLQAINCLKLMDGYVYGENTDYMAILDILKRYQALKKNLFVTLLGDGVMSQVTQFALDELNIPWQLFSRKKTAHFDQLNLDQFDKHISPLVINTCSRNYMFSGKLRSDVIFWDYNYNFDEHRALIVSQSAKYQDGMEMLELQAGYAIAFWSAI